MLKFTEISESEYRSYCVLKKSLIGDCFILSNLNWFTLFETFRNKGSRSKSVVNSVNLIQDLVSFLDGGDMGSSGTSSSSLLTSWTVSTIPLTVSSTDNGRDSLVATSLSKSTSSSGSKFSGVKSGLASRSWFRSNSNLLQHCRSHHHPPPL